MLRTNYNWLRFLKRLWTFSAHFCSFTNCSCSFLLVYQMFLLVSTRLPFTSRLYSFMSRSISTPLLKAPPVLLNLIWREDSINLNHLWLLILLQHFKWKREKNVTRDLFLWYILPRRYYNMPSEQFLPA